MKCPICGNDYEVFDFFGKKKCYRCIYSEKMILMRNFKKINLCKICNKKIPSKRWIFCSDECSKVEHKEPWYYKISVFKLHWRDYSKWHG